MNGTLIWHAVRIPTVLALVVILLWLLRDPWAVVDAIRHTWRWLRRL